MAERARRGQSAMEYLITYGWALLIMLAVLATLYSMGLFRPSRYMPQECVFQPGFACSSFILKQVPSGYNLTFTAVNGLGFELLVEEANLSAEDLGFPGKRVYSPGTCLPSECVVLINRADFPSGVIKPGDSVEFSFLILNNTAAPSVGSLERTHVSLAYRNCAVAKEADCSDGTPHFLSGRVTAVVEPG